MINPRVFSQLLAKEVRQSLKYRLSALEKPKPCKNDKNRCASVRSRLPELYIENCQLCIF